MSDIIKVHDLPGIEDYGKSISEFSKSYSAAVSDTERTFSLKKQNSELDALEAFYNKLNILQEKVFHKVPEALEKYSTTNTVFSSTVKNAGFEVKAWTSESGKGTVTQTLTGDQTTAVSDVKSKLQPALDTATQLLEIDSINLSPIQSKAEEELSTESTNRTNTHNAVDGAHRTFVQGLDETTETINRLQRDVNNAKSILRMPADFVMNSISHKVLTKDKMYYLDSMSSDVDASVVKDVLSESPGNIMKQRPEEISESAYNVLSAEVTDWVIRGKKGDKLAEKKLNHFVGAMGDEPTTKVDQFTTSMLQAGDREAWTLIANMKQNRAKNPNDPKIGRDQERLTNVNEFIGLMKSINLLDIGYGTEISELAHETYKIPTFKSTTTTKRMKNIDITNSGVTFSVSTNIKAFERKNVLDTVAVDQPIKDETTTETYRSGTMAGIGANLVYNKAKAAELQKAREDALEAFQKDVTASVSKGIVNTILPGSVTVLELLQSFSGDDESKAEGLASLSDYIPSKKGSNALSAISNVAKAQFAFNSKVDELQQEKLEQTQKSIGEYLRKGTWYLEGDKKTYTDSSSYYDFNATLRAEEMDDRGMLGYVETKVPEAAQSGLTPEQWIQKQIENNNVKLDDETKNYLMGKSDQKISDMNQNQIDKLTNALNGVINGNDSTGNKGVEKYILYLDEKYEYKEN